MIFLEINLSSLIYLCFRSIYLFFFKKKEHGATSLLNKHQREKLNYRIYHQYDSA